MTARCDIERRVARYPDLFVKRYLDAGAWRDETIGAAFHQVALERDKADAVIGVEQRLSFRELDELSDRFAAALLDQGLVPGDRVLFQITNDPNSVIAYYGTVKAGLIPVCAIPQHGERDMRELARQAEPRAYFVSATFQSQDLQAIAEVVAANTPSIGLIVVTEGAARLGQSLQALLDSQDAREARRAVEAVGARAEDVAVFQLSGGTTGTPKIIPRLHCEYAYNSRRWSEVWGWGADMPFMHVGPLIHNAGLAAAMQPAHFVGAPLVLPPKPDAGLIFELIEREHVQVLPVMPPALLLRLLKFERRSEYDISSLRYVIASGQKLPLELADRVETELGLRCLQLFGMGEGMFIRTPADAPEWVRKQTVGEPMSPLDEVRILEPDTEDEVPVGQLGELCCRGPYTIRGYYDARDRNAVAFTSDGFYRTGDVARSHSVAGRTYFSVEGRLKDMINRGAEKINAGEVEAVVAAHASVSAVAVVSMPDPDMGERACACVVLERGAKLTLEDLTSFMLAQGMAKFKLPERLEIFEEFPVANMGKVSKKDLRADVEARMRAAQVEPRAPV